MTVDTYLVFGAALLALGVWAGLLRPSPVSGLLALQVATSGILVTAAALWYFVAPYASDGLVLALVLLCVLAVEAAVGFTILLALHRDANTPKNS